MPYRYLDDIAIADAAFDAWGATLEEMLAAAIDAVTNVMVSNIDAVRPLVTRHLRVEDQDLDMLLFQTLQEIVYYKDSKRLLLRAADIRIEQSGDGTVAIAELAGEPIDPSRHHMVVDVKAITLHRLDLQKRDNAWHCTVVVDV